MTASSSMVLSGMLDAIILDPDECNSALIEICKQIKVDTVQYTSRLSPAAHAGALQALHGYMPNIDNHKFNEGVSDNEGLLETTDPDLRLLKLLGECLADGFLPGPASDAIQVTNDLFRVVNLAAVLHPWESAVSTSTLLDLAIDANKCDYFLSYV